MIIHKYITKILALLLAAVMVLPTAAFANDEAADEAAPAALENLTIEENPMGTVEIIWDAVEGAAYYEVASPGVNGGEPAVTEEAMCTVSGLDHGVAYEFNVAACDESGTVVAEGDVSITTVAYRIKFNENSFRKLKSKTVTPRKFNINLRKMIGEPHSGYAVVQGGCTDGTYAYYLMVSTATQKGRVLKVRIKDRKVIKRSKVLNTWHGNGMAYDSKRKKLVVISREHRKQEITQIDAKTLKITRQKNAKYSYNIDAWTKKLSQRYKQSGLAAIAYVKKYDCYIALERVYHNLLIFDPDTFECIGLVYTELGKTGTFQAMDADSRYVYLLLSYYNDGSVVQPYNKIVALDWNSENLLPVVNACKSKDLPYVPRAWRCNNDGKGKPDASIRIRTKHEAENIYHTTDKNGKEHFYMSEYYGHKVKRKYHRDNYVYDLGVI
ncbi:MAG: hypothetical protein IJG48_09565 [Mogibacterium sp.]|nr:hypothetical protein [Mogibacterium sp.]